MTPIDGDAARCSLHEETIAGAHRFSHAAMASVFEVYCVHDDGEYARQAARRAFTVVDRLELDLSRFVENSDITRINHLVAGESARVSVWTMECLQIARLLYEETGGVFDVSIGSGLEHLELVRGDYRVQAQAEGIRIDLGGIGKGYAVDRIAEELADWEVDRALVHAGSSSVLALAPPPELPGWPLTLSNPWSGSIVARILARDQALSGSGIRKGDHILEPRTGQPVRFRAAAWVSAHATVWARFCERAGVGHSAAAVADAVSTAFMILPAEKLEAFCLDHPGMESWILQGSQDQPEASSLLHFPVG